MKVFLLGAAIAFIGYLMAGCSSVPKNEKGYQKDEVLSTVNDSPQPVWADETVPFRISDGKVLSVGVTTLRGSDRPEAGARIAENNSRANFAKVIENRMEFIFQNSEENSSLDSTNAKYIGSEVSNLTSHSMMVEGMWYKRYAQSDEDGSRHIYYKIYSLVTMPEAELKKAVNAAINKTVTDHKLSENFQSQVNSQWNRFIEGNGNTSPNQEVVAQKITQ